MKPSCLVSEDNTYTQSFSRYNIFTTCNKEDMWYWDMDLSIWNCHWYTLGSIGEQDSESCSVSKPLLQNSDSSSSLPFLTQHMLQCCQSLKGSQGTSDGYETGDGFGKIYKSVPFELNPFKSDRIRWCRLQTARPTTEWCHGCCSWKVTQMTWSDQSALNDCLDPLGLPIHKIWWTIEPKEDNVMLWEP